MNYLEQIVGFHRWKEVNPLPASAIALWYELMSICNKAGWPEEFTVPNAMIQATAGLSRKQFESARQLLINHGLITYKKSKRVNHAGKYSIIPLSIVQNGQQKGQQKGQREEHEEGNDRDNLLKDKHKQNQTETEQQLTSRVFKTFEQEGFGTLSSLLVEDLNDLIDTYSAPWVIQAMHEAVKSGKRTLRYVNGILKNWKASGIDEPWNKEPADNDADKKRRHIKAVMASQNKTYAPREELWSS